MPDPTLALCTFSTGKAQVREVLGDWLGFLPRRPERVIVSTLLDDGEPRPVYRELADEGVIDELVTLEAPGLDGRTAETLGTLSALKAAADHGVDYALQVKLDTLPYRDGHDGWLDEALTVLREGGFAAFTGSMSDERGETLSDVPQGVPRDRYFRTRRFSVNFALLKPGPFVARVVESLGGDWCLDPAAFVGRGGDEGSRFAVEEAMTDALKTEGRHCVARHETPDWTVFHVNVWGERLAAVRERYRRRDGIKPFLNRGDITPGSRPDLWHWQYGTPVPTLTQRLRVKVGRWRRGL